MRFVLAGASGFLGRPLVRSLLADGHDVVVLTRRPNTAASGHREVGWQPDGTAGPWAEVLDGADGVVNLAGESIAGGRWTPARKAAITESRLLSTRSLVAAIDLAKVRPPVLVSGSAVGFYGPHGEEVVTEADGAADDFLGRLSLEWERAAQAAESGGTRVVLVRTGLVLERDGGALKAMLLPFQLGVGGPLGAGTQYLAVDPSRRLDRADAFPAGPSQCAWPGERDGARFRSPTKSSRGPWHACSGVRASSARRPSSFVSRWARWPSAPPHGTARGARPRARAGVPVPGRDAGAGVAGHPR